MNLFVTNNINQWLFSILLLAVTFSLPYHAHITSVFIIMLGISWLFQGKLLEKLRSFISNKLALLFISLYILYLIAVLIGKDKNTGFYILEIKLSLLVFPLIISTSRIDESSLKKTLSVFVFTCFLASLASFMNVFLLHKHYGHTLSSIRFDSFNRENIALLLKIHPTYFSIYLFFSNIIVCYYLYRFWKSITVTKKVSLIFLVFYFLLINVLLSARMPLVSFFILMAMIGIKFITSQRKNLIWVAASFVVLICFSAYLYKYPFINSRFQEMNETAWQAPKGQNYNSTNLRIGYLICTFELLQSKWLIGVGPAQMQNELNNCYQSKGFSEQTVGGNPHNQFLQTWLELGIFGLLVLMAVFIIPLRLALKKVNFLYLAFLIFFCLCCLTESVLSVQKGVVFYAFFNSLFAFHSLRKNNSL